MHAHILSRTGPLLRPKINYGGYYKKPSASCGIATERGMCPSLTPHPFSHFPGHAEASSQERNCPPSVTFPATPKLAHRKGTDMEVHLLQVSE